MKMKRMIKLLCSAAMVCGAFSMSAVNAYAVDETKAPEATTVVSTEKVTLESTKPIPETTDTTEITTISPDETIEETDDTSEDSTEETTIPLGNGILLEDKNDDVVDRQFLTIQSKNGNTFYIIVDKDSKGKENVYFMNLVDEYDLLAFAEKFPEGAAEKPADKKEPVVTDPNGEPIEEVATDENGKPVEEKPDNKADGGNNTLLIIVGVLALAGGGAFYYFKFVKNKQKAPKQPAYPDEEDDEYAEETVNEDFEE